MEVIQFSADCQCKHTSEQDEAQDFYRQGEVSSGFQGLPPVLSGARVAADVKQKASAHLALENLGFQRSQTQHALAMLHERNKARIRTQLFKAIQAILNKPTVEIYLFSRTSLLTRRDKEICVFSCLLTQHPLCSSYIKVCQLPTLIT